MAKKTNFLKRFEAWATDLKRNLFLRARLRLTLFYTGLIIIVLIIFSLSLYISFLRNIKNDIEKDFPNPRQERLIVHRSTSRLAELILFIDGGIILFVGFFGFFLTKETLEPIQQTLEAQKKFAADAAHELRTPLAVIKTDLEIFLRTDHEETPERKIMASNLEEVNRMSRIVNNLLSLVRLESNQENFRFGRINLSQLTDQTLKNISSYALNKKIKMKKQFEPDLYVLADQTKLEETILNLLKNAVDYSKDNGLIEVELKKTKNKAELSIRDYGIGISDQDLPHIFERFFRADNARQNKKTGSGLGLAIVREIVRKHRGQIQIESKLNQGAIVIVTLPLFSS